jgi:putative heme transporter
VFRGWGISPQGATSSVALYGIIATLGRLALPLFAVLILVATGDLVEARQSAVIITAISIVIFFVATGVMMAVVSSERAADRIGRAVGRIALWILQRLGRTERPDVDGAIHRFQVDLGEIVHRSGLAALAVNLLAQVPWVISFVVALRFTGVPEEVLPASSIIAVFALVAVITIIPIAPGGVGVPELLYIAGLSSIAGESWEAAITAGVFLFRLYVWFLPIPLAWVLLKLARRGRPMLPTAVELRSYAITGA